MSWCFQSVPVYIEYLSVNSYCCVIVNRGSVREANPNISGKDSTASTASTGSSEGSSSSSESSDIEGDIEILTEDEASPEISGSSYISLKVSIVKCTSSII